jgi:hypothetical protein
MRLYSREELDRVPWPDTPDGDYARRVLSAFMRDGATRYVANAEAEVRVLVAGEVVLPVAVVEGLSRLANPSYVVSPTTHYVDYAKREVELELHDRSVLRRLFPPLLECFRPLLRWGEVEKAVYVNNWLLSTNLFPRLPPGALQALHELLRGTFPCHALVFRSVSRELNGEVAWGLRGLGYRPVFSRQVYLLDPRTGSHRRKKSFQKDRGLARRTPYAWLDAAALTEADCPRLKRLYDDLYLDKYSPYNPQFTEDFFHEALRSGWLELWALRAEGRIDAVLGLVRRQGAATTPMIGYDRSLPAELGLYRLVSLKLVELAERHGLVLHQSSGASKFKMHRGSVPSVEHSYVFDLHLPRRRRLPWQVLACLSEYVAEPLMRRLGL